MVVWRATGFAHFHRLAQGPMGSAHHVRQTQAVSTALHAELLGLDIVLG